MEQISLLTEIQAAKRIGVKRDTLTKWRCRGRGPIFIKMSGMVRYRDVDILAWIEASRIDPAKRRRSRRRAAK
jgi:predicted DNA-binding transcriptional regulator AlpA